MPVSRVSRVSPISPVSRHSHSPTRRGVAALAGLVVAWAGLVGPAATSAFAAPPFPERIALPDGWRPEGIATGRGPVAYAGSLADGAIYATDLRTGEGTVLVDGMPGRVAVGLEFDRRTNALYVAGGATGLATVYDAATGDTLGTYVLATGGSTFVNDAVVTRDAVYFTDSARPVLYRLPLDRRTRLPTGIVQTIPLSGSYQQVSGFNLNGIEAGPNGDALYAVHSTLGVLYRIDPATGIATTVDLGGASLTAGDGLLLQGATLYVVRNRLNQVVAIDLAADGLSGTVTDVVTSPAFDVPTTIAAFGDRLYVVNARFGTPPTPTTPYDIVQVPR